MKKIGRLPILAVVALLHWALDGKAQTTPPTPAPTTSPPSTGQDQQALTTGGSSGPLVTFQVGVGLDAFDTVTVAFGGASISNLGILPASVPVDIALVGLDALLAAIPDEVLVPLDVSHAAIPEVNWHGIPATSESPGFPPPSKP